MGVGTLVDRQQAKLLRLLKPSAADCVRDMQTIRPLRTGDIVGEWVEWWVDHASGAYPPLRTYPTAWVAPYVSMIRVLQSLLLPQHQSRVAERAMVLFELALELTRERSLGARA